MNGRLILEGALRIYWGVRGVIHLKEDDDQRTVVTARHRNSCRRSVADVCISKFQFAHKEKLNYVHNQLLIILFFFSN